jgi:hypothetical protein
VVTVTPPSALQAAMDRDQQQQQRLTDEHNLGRWSDFAQPALKHRHLLQGTYPALTPGSPSPADAATLAAPRQHMMPPGSSSTTGTGSHSSSNSKPDSGRTQHVDKVAGDTGAPQSGLGGHPVIVHPCLHDGFEAEYLRIPFHGTLPQPPQVKHWVGQPPRWVHRLLLSTWLDSTIQCKVIAAAISLTVVCAAH